MVVLEEILKKNATGFYVDLGCSEERAETKKFEDAGWKGIHVDARINYAVYSYDGYVDFYDLGSVHPDLKFYSGVKENLYMSKAQAVFPNIDISASPYMKTKRVECKKLETILDENDINEITFLKIDVEGSEHEVLSVFPFDKYKIDYILIEGDACNKLLVSNGFNLIGNEKANALYKYTQVNDNG